jgi:Terminase RNaseH-like domain
LKAIDGRLRACTPGSEQSDNQRLSIWLPAQAGKAYIIGVDPAGGGTEGDYCCAEVIERRTGLQCAELHGHFPPQELAYRLIELGRTYNQALLVVERNNHGAGVLAYLNIQGYENLYREKNQDGWLTSVATRPMMVETLAAMLSISPQIFASSRFLNECRTFVRYADGSSGAVSGTHDDCVMAMAIAQAARQRIAGENHSGSPSTFG